MLIQHPTERYCNIAKTKIKTKIIGIGSTKPPKNFFNDPLITKVYKNRKPEKLIVVDPSDRFLRTHKKG
jgi:hypothetical protein